MSGKKLGWKMPVRAALLWLLGGPGCVCQPPDEGARGASTTAPAGEYGVAEEALRPDPKVDKVLTKRVQIPGTLWTARIPETWVCSSEGTGMLACSAQDGRATSVGWTLVRRPGGAKVKDLVTATLQASEGPLSERKVVRGEGVTGVFVRKMCLKAQCLDPVLVLYGPETEAGREELSATGSCDRTDCDVEQTVGVMYSASRSE